MIDNEFSNMRVIVTGASGFVGKSLIKRLSEDNRFSVVALSRKENHNNALLECCNWSVTDYSVNSLSSLLKNADIIIHLAGLKGTESRLSDYDIDMRMTENILSAMDVCDVPKIIYASSRLVYGNPDTVPWTEETTPEPALAYAVNKLRCESLCANWAQTHNAVALSIRVAQVLGIGERTRNMINVFQETALNGDQLKVIGKSIAKRQYIYTEDLSEILYRLIISEQLESGIMNIGMVESYTNLEIAQAVNKAFRNDTPISYDDSTPETITQSIMDVKKMLQVTGYTPMNMDQALIEIYSSLHSS